MVGEGVGGGGNGNKLARCSHDRRVVSDRHRKLNSEDHVHVVIVGFKASALDIPGPHGNTNQVLWGYTANKSTIFWVHGKQTIGIADCTTTNQFSGLHGNNVNDLAVIGPC